MAETLPTMAILARISENSVKNKEEIFTRLFRYMLRPDLYFEAYKNLYANEGAATKGVDNDTADGFSEAKIAIIIESLHNGTYQPKPVRRTYIENRNNPSKKRPLGIPTFTDKLVQEVLRMILEAVYEPVFMNCSHGFRRNKSCHTAFKSLKKEFTGARWFIEGDIKGCFDNIDHSVLVGLLNNKVKDAKLIQLVWKILKAGYMENWQYNKTYSGTPQGGIISPLLANIYLHELDKFTAKLKSEFNAPATRARTSEYVRIRSQKNRLSKKIDGSTGVEREYLLSEYKRVRGQLLKTPSKTQDDKCMKYIRYADDFLISVNGNKQDCEDIKRKLTEFIGETLKMELSEQKTLITHSNEHARFLGYDVRVRRDQTVKPHGKYTQRTLSGSVELNVPLDDKVRKFLFTKGCVEQTSDGTMFPIHRNNLIGMTELEIVTTFNAELRGICNYYSLSSNYCSLRYFSYLMEYSCLKTLAAKRKSSIRKTLYRLRDRKGGWGVPYETKHGKKKLYFAKYSECKAAKFVTDVIDTSAARLGYSRNSFENRLKAYICELCGATETPCQVHHVNKVKNLKGKEDWEIAMIAKRRKTLVVCEACHKKIHQNNAN